MFTYNLQLAVNSILKTRYLSVLMIIAIALGIGLSMTIVTVYNMMAADPIPEKSAALHVVRLDSWSAQKAFREPNVAPYQLTYQDAMALRKSTIPSNQAAMFRTGFVAQPQNDSLLPFPVDARATDRGFFDLFDVPFLYGNAWTADIDQNPAQVIVLSKTINDKLFGGEDSVGRTVKLDEHLFEVVGVLDEFAPPMKYYDISNGPFNDPDDTYIPFTLTATLELDSWGNTNGWKGETIDSFASKLTSELAWIQYWALLETPAQIDEYQAFLDSHALEQKKLGRFERPLNNQLTPLMAWLEEREVVGSETKVLLALALMFLIVCLLNVVGLILAKFSGKSSEISVRRALGADKATLFTQHLIESAVIGGLGGLVGLGLAMLGLAGITALAPDISNMATADYRLVIYTLLLSIVCTLLAGLYPTWRVCQIQPASYLKTQ